MIRTDDSPIYRLRALKATSYIGCIKLALYIDPKDKMCLVVSEIGVFPCLVNSQSEDYDSKLLRLEFCCQLTTRFTILWNR